ncbi:hypothetical protein A2U01_0088274, partial [Trifolium medium]|nr:hypothetical protein [Trifolium medium]
FDDGDESGVIGDGV